MRILFIADIMGSPGRRAVRALLPPLLQEAEIDFCIANGENAAGGNGCTPVVAEELFALGINVLTGGNHIWDKREIIPYIERQPRLLRPANFPPGNPGSGSVLLPNHSGIPVGVLNLQGRVFMKEIECPFRVGEAAVRELRAQTPIILVDFHAEATSEKMAMGWFLDGTVSACLGTHSHVQTADERILPQGTAYLTDTGLTGSLDSVIGIKREQALHKFLTQMPVRFEPANQNLWMMGVILTVDEQTGQATEIRRFQLPLKEEGWAR